MATIQRIIPSLLLCAASTVLLVAGGATAQKDIENTATAPWRQYASQEAGFTFKYPQGWEIIDDDFYVTAGGAVATQRSITLQKTGDENSDNWIRINPRQFEESDGKCLKAGKEDLCTYSKDAEILAVFQIPVASFDDLAKTPKHRHSRARGNL